MGRAPLRLRRAEAGQRTHHGRRHHRFLPRQLGALQGAADGDFRRAAEDLDWQNPEICSTRQGQRLEIEPIGFVDCGHIDPLDVALLHPERWVAGHREHFASLTILALASLTTEGFLGKHPIG